MAPGLVDEVEHLVDVAVADLLYEAHGVVKVHVPAGGELHGQHEVGEEQVASVRLASLPGCLANIRILPWALRVVVAFASMPWIRRMLAATVAVALLAAGCGKDTEDTGVTTIGLLSAALAESAEASNYRVSLSAGTKWKIAGSEVSTGLDGENPAFTCEVTSERQHCIIDVSTLLESLLGFALDDWDEFGFEMWVDQERVVVDTRALQPLADEDPDADLEIMAPGLFFVDLAAFEAGSSELMDAVAGSSTPDLKQMAASLPAALITIEQTSTDPSTFVGTTTSARLIEALGGDVEADARCEAAQLDTASPADRDELAELIVQYYETNTAEVVIELDDRGLLSVLWTKEDYSGLLRIFAEFEGLVAEMSEQERQDAVETSASMELIVATRVAYEPDVDLEVPLPPPTTEDRTEGWREFLPECG